MKVMLIGPSGSGKSTLINNIEYNSDEATKTMVPEYHQHFLDTPGEYLEHKMFYGRLQVLVADFDIIGFVIPCNIDNFYIPPNFMSMFPEKKGIGIITKTDLSKKGDIERCEEILIQAGVKKFFKISIYDKNSIANLNNYFLGNKEA